MMPSKTFDYKVVDFSTFQGGSTNVSNQVNFEQTMVRKCISFILCIYIQILTFYFVIFPEEEKRKDTKKEEAKIEYINCNIF